ncbi:MAG: hypothetical protein FNP40_09360 [Dehalobacter sp. 4CP]|nr:hypothetical protein [Dehalobacter sp. 4CP]
MSAIESLNFFKERVELAGPNGFQISRAHADRTVAVVRKFLESRDSLRTARQETMTCLAALPGKGGKVELAIADPDRFNALQESIEAHSECMEALETAIRELDAMGAPMFEELNYKVGSLGHSEHAERQQIANMTSGYLARRANSGKTPDEILAADPEYNRLKALCEKRIEQSNKQHAELKPKLDQMKAILESVGC